MTTEFSYRQQQLADLLTTIDGVSMDSAKAIVSFLFAEDLIDEYVLDSVYGYDDDDFDDEYYDEYEYYEDDDDDDDE